MEKISKFKRWETPLSDSDTFNTVTIIDDGELILSFEDKANQDMYRLRMIFQTYASYRYTLEQFLSDEKAWDKIQEVRKKYGSTMIADETEWIQQIVENCLFEKDHIMSELKHYLILIPMEGVLEIAAQKPPKLYDF
jgi:hypothetical protein